VSTVQAWRLNVGRYSIAIGHSDLVEVLVEAESRPLPIGPQGCRELLAWRGLYLPLGRFEPGEQAKLVVVIAARVGEDGQIDYVAIRVRKPPELITVTAGSDCDPPQGSRFPGKHLLACFKHQDEVIAVPDVAALFGLQPALGATE
jgi:hypothetical protein